MSPLGIEVLVACGLGLLAQRIWRGEKHAAARLWALTVISAGVIAWWQPLALVVTLALTGATWLAIRAARAGEAGQRGRAVAAGVAALVLALAVFKYTPWLLSLVG